MNEKISYYNKKKSLDAYLYGSMVFPYLNKKGLNSNSEKVQLSKNFRCFGVLLLIMFFYMHPVVNAQTKIGSFAFLYNTSLSSSVNSSTSSRISFLFPSSVKSIKKNNFFFCRNFKKINIINSSYGKLTPEVLERWNNEANIDIPLLHYYSIIPEDCVMQVINRNKRTDNIPARLFLFTNFQYKYNSAPKMSLIPDGLFKKNSKPDKNADKEKSFFRSNLFYFVGAAVLAVTVYLLWPKKESPANSNVTFGVPPLPH